jgi:hypothetical protein
MLFVSASHLLCKLAEHQSAISRNFTEEKLIEVFNTRPSRFFKTNEWFFKALKDLIKNSGCSIFEGVKIGQSRGKIIFFKSSKNEIKI